MTQQVAPASKAEVPNPKDTISWLVEHCPRAEPWYRLWQADRESLRLAMEATASSGEVMAKTLRKEHTEAERSASLWYLSELIAAETRAELALRAHDVRPDVVARVEERRLRLRELADEVVKATEPKS
jgi:hypothetical protein